MSQKINPELFPILCGPARKPNLLLSALETISTAIEDGTIRNTVFQEAKFTLSRAADDAWKSSVSEPFFYGGKWESQPKEIVILMGSIMVMGLHDVVSASKKVAKSTASGPAIDAMRAYCAEVLPLALAVADLKSKVVKGRAPSIGPTKPVNPNKIVKTCPVCFRAVAVVGATMAHHGYRRPGDGFQTASCPGIRFRPLEISSDGLVWLIDTLRKTIDHRKMELAEREVSPTHLMTRRTGSTPPEKVARDHPYWPKLFAAYISGLESEVSALTQELPSLEKKLREWTPKGLAEITPAAQAV